MPSVSGQVLFNVTNTSPATGSAVSGVQVALIDNSTGNGLIVDTNGSGSYQFDNVNEGSYTIVECFGATPSVASPGDFSTAALITALTPADPDIGSVPSPPATANAVQSLSRNTITPVTVVASNITGQNFVDGPVNNAPLTVLDTNLVGGNLVTAAANGTWGTLPNGTIVPTQPATPPYPDVVQGFGFVQATSLAPGDGSYSIININTFTQFSGWFNTADHTSRDETGRLILVNGANPGAIIFTQTIPNVTPNSYYLLSLWVMNLYSSGILPAVGVKVLTLGGSTIFNQALSNIPTTLIPTWRESSTLLSVGSNSSVILQVYSNGAAGGGNDYAIDDIAFTEAQIDTVLTTNKYVSKDFADVGDTLDYTIVLTNTGQSTMQNIVFSDTIPGGTNFKTGTVKINNTTFGGLNPTPPGFTLTSPSTMKSGDVVTINFSVLVNTLPTVNPIPNSSVTNYSITPVLGGAAVPQISLSNIVNTQVNQAVLSSNKSRDLAFVTIGDIITYTIPIGNLGTTIANNVVFSDTIPNGTTLVPGSVYVNGGIILNTTPNPPGINLGSIDIGTITTVVFQVIVTTIPTPNPILNSASTTYNYTVDPSIPIVKSNSTNTNIVSSQFNDAILGATKLVNKQYANIGDVLTYTIPIVNIGNVTANNIIFIDTIPNDTTLVPGSLLQDGVSVLGGDPTPPGTTLPNGIRPLSISTITFKVTVNTIPNPNPIPNSAALTYNYTIDPISNPNRVGSNSAATNTVTTQVNNANLGNISKFVDKNFATCGDTVTYTIVLPNSGNITAFNVIVKDTLPSGTALIPTSVIVNNVSTSGADPQTGITIPNIGPGTAATIIFSVKVNCL